MNGEIPVRGDVLLYRGKGLVSRMVKRVTGSPYSHAAWVLSEHAVLESEWTLFGERGGVHVNELHKYDLRRCDFFRLQGVSREELEIVLQEALQHLNDRYDWSLFFALFKEWVKENACFWRWFQNPNKRKLRLRNQRHGWICSELIATPLYRKLEWTFSDRTPYEATTPGDIAESQILGRVRKLKVH